MPLPSPRVLVTGGGFGLGCATVKFLLEKHNARVVVLTIDFGSELEALQREYSNDERLYVSQGDVTNVLCAQTPWIVEFPNNALRRK